MEESARRPPLLPDRMHQEDFFVCDIFDAVPKADMASMEHPVFSISTKPDRRVRRYENGSNFIEISPSAKGLATVHDRDILIFCISQLMAALNRGETVSKTLHFKAYDMLTATNRPTGGKSYSRLREALARLQGTQIETNITTGDAEVLDGFSLIDRFRIVRETREGRMQEVEVELSEWVFSAIKAREVLTIHRDYFRLRKPLERRMYELARKHCGQKRSWRIGLTRLQEKCGSTSAAWEFHRMVRKIVSEDETHGHMPDYAVSFDGDMVVFTNRNTMKLTPAAPSWIDDIRLDSDTYDEAREAAPGWDPYYIEQEWRNWLVTSGKEPPRKPDLAFIRFCMSFYERRGAPA